jgi:HlyD family secretion protein
MSLRQNLVLGALTVLLGCKPGGQRPDVPTITVKKTRFARTIHADGNLKPVQTTVLTAPRSPDGAMRIAWLAEDGATVKKGDVVARFDDSELRSRLMAAQDDRTTASARKQQEGVSVAHGRSDRQRTTEAAERELTTTRTFERKDTELYSRDDIVTYQIDEKLQTAKADHARNAQVVDRQVARRKLQLLEVQTRKAAEAISRAEKGLQMLEIRAPHDGVLVFKRNWRNETLAVGDPGWGPIAEISLSSKMEAEVFVLEVEAAGLAKGKKAEVILESQPGLIWKAEVTRVESVAKRRVFKSPTQYFGVTLSLEKTDAAFMKPGQRMRANLMLDDRESIVVPRPALVERDGKWVAFRRDGQGFTAVPVKLGTSTAGLVAIDSGLNEGDVIALRDPGQSLDEILSAPAAGAGKAR